MLNIWLNKNSFVNDDCECLREWKRFQREALRIFSKEFYEVILSQSIYILSSFKKFLEFVSEEISTPVKRIFGACGDEITSVNLIRENEILYASNGEDFIDTSSKIGLIHFSKYGNFSRERDFTSIWRTCKSSFTSSSIFRVSNQITSPFSSKNSLVRITGNHALFSTLIGSKRVEFLFRIESEGISRWVFNCIQWNTIAKQDRFGKIPITFLPKKAVLHIFKYHRASLFTYIKECSELKKLEGFDKLVGILTKLEVMMRCGKL